MKKTATYKDWQRLFRKETGRSAHDVKYNPAPSINVPVYTDVSGRKKTSSSSVTEQITAKIKHSLILPSSIQEFFSQGSEILSQYHVFEIRTIGFSEIENEKLRQKWNSSAESKTHFSNFQPDQLLFLDHTKIKQNLILLRDWRDHLFKNHNTVWHFPDDDFLWNIGVINGIKKYLSLKHPEILSETATYIPLSQIPNPGEEDQLIALTNRLLSTAAAGITHFIWDLREMTSWQKKNFHLLLNVPEILHRESRLYSYGNATDGSDFFENLAEEIFQFLVKR